MNDRDDLRERLDAVEDEVGDETTPGFESPILYTDGDGGYVTEDGDPVPTTPDGGPDTSVFNTTGPAIILSGEYDPRDAGGPAQ